MNWKTKWYNTKINSIVFLMLIGLFPGVFYGCADAEKQTNKPTKNSRVAALPYYKDAAFTPHWLEAGSDKANNFHQIPPFKLWDQEGKEITEQTFKDKIYVTDFFFTSCPGICPQMTNNMAIIQNAFLDDEKVLLLSHSVTPEADSISVLKAYADNKGVLSKKWHLVTGAREVIYNLGRNAYFVEENLGLQKAPDDFLHTENFVLIDSQRHIRGIYNGLNKNAIEQLIADIKTLKKEI